MATVTDSLVTLLQLKGGPQYVQQMQTAAGATDKLATQQKGLSQATKELAGAFGVALGAAGAIAAGVGLLKAAASAFAESETAIFRATVVLRNLGNSYPIEKAQAFASALQATTAADDEAVVGTLALLKQFGVADKQLEPLTKSILDLSAATGIDLKQATELVGRASLGQTRGLRALGIQISTTGTQAQKLIQIQEKLNALFGGAAAAQTNTLQGSLERLKQSFSNVLESAGAAFSAFVPLINKLSDALNNLSNNKVLSGGLIGGGAGAGIGASIGAFFGNPLLGALIGGGIGGGLGALGGLFKNKNAAEQIGNGKARAATEATLQKIADNTAQLSPFIRQVIGGTGEVARRSFTFRDARMSFGV